jgi:hypothetical protein
MLGHCHSVFIHPLVAELQKCREVTVSVLELLAPGSETRGVSNPVYDRILKLPRLECTSNNTIKLIELARDIFHKGGSTKLSHLIKDIPRYGIRGNFRNAFRMLKGMELWLPFLNGYDLYHLHYLHEILNEPISYLRPDAPVVLSIWGSDLMDTAGVDVYRAHMTICERADIITVRSSAMREIFLSKFGRRFLPKVHLAKFGIGILDTIDSLSKETSRAIFCARHHIDPRKRIICLGHSGAQRDRHVQMLKSLGPVADVLKKSATVVLPMTYEGSSDYRKLVSAAAEESGLCFRILTEYLSTEDVSMLRLSSDVMVLLPEQDALSGAMCETIYAGNAVITGAWLPYMELWDQHVELFRIADFHELPQTLVGVLRDFDSLKSRLSENRIKVRPLVDYKHSIDGWFAAYNAALAARPKRIQ